MQSDDDDSLGKETAIHERRKQSYWERFRRLKVDNQIIAVSNLVLAATTGVYVLVSILTWLTISKDSQTASQQTDKLIKAANIQALAAQRNADAAQSFANTATQIKSTMSDAVTQLQRSAENSEIGIRQSNRNAQESITANVNALEVQQRAWVGITEPVANSVGLNQTSSIPSRQDYFLVVDGQIKLTNFGPSPAFDVATAATLIPAESIDSGMAKNACITAKESFDKGIKELQTEKVDIYKQDTTILPHQEIPYPFATNISITKPTQSFPYVMVCMYYRDEFHKVHHTNQCLGAPWGGQPHPMVVCPWYNQAD